MEDHRRDPAEKEAASRRATDVKVLEDAERLGTTRRAQKEALTNLPGPSHPFLRVEKEKISNRLT